jgi:hypothetical protein
VYYDGVFNWPGDWSYAATANYQDTSGGPIDGPFDIAISVTGQWGGWLPYAPVNSASVPTFNASAYSYIVFAIKATKSPISWQVLFHYENAPGEDTNDGAALDVTPYALSTPTVGTWVYYKVPLSAFGLTSTTIEKFSIADESGNATNTFYLDNVGFE